MHSGVSRHDNNYIEMDDYDTTVISPFHVHNLEVKNTANYLTPSEHIQITSHPETYTHFLLKPVLFWIFPLIRLASKRTIVETDIWDSPPDMRIFNTAGMLTQEWNKEKDKCNLFLLCLLCVYLI